MRLYRTALRGLHRRFGTVALALGLAGAAAPAVAGGYYEGVVGSYDSVHADSFGNLIIMSPAGYKRIVVGQGHLARELAEYSRAGAEEIVYDDHDHGRYHAYRGCPRHGVLLRGRSYMYGLPDNVVPVLVGQCR